MAASNHANSAILRRIHQLRHFISSYKLNEFLNDDVIGEENPKLVIGIIETSTKPQPIVPALRRALHHVDNDSGRGEYFDQPMHKEEYLTDSVSVIVGSYYRQRGSRLMVNANVTKDLLGKVECFVLLLDSAASFPTQALSQIKEETGRIPIVALCKHDDKEENIEMGTLIRHQIYELYKIPFSADSLSNENVLQLLTLLYRCVMEGCMVLAAKTGKLSTHPYFHLMWEHKKKSEQIAEQEEEKKILNTKIRELEQLNEQMESNFKKELASKEQCVMQLQEEIGKLKKKIQQEAERAVEPSVLPSQEKRGLDGAECDAATGGTAVQCDQQDSQQHDSPQSNDNIECEQTSQAPRSHSSTTNLEISNESPAGELFCSPCCQLI